MPPSRGLACSAEFMRRFERLATEAGWDPAVTRRGAKKHVVDALRHHLCLSKVEIYRMLTAARLRRAVNFTSETNEVPHPVILQAAATAGQDSESEIVELAIANGWTKEEILAEVRRRRLEHVPPLPKGFYSVIYADPPWSFSNAGLPQSAASHYPTMSTADIAALALPLAHDAVCFLWVPNALLPDGLMVLKAWGFSYKTNFVWIKTRASGLGWYCQTHHETVLFGIRGDPPDPQTKPRSVVSGGVGRHSAKPPRFYELIESMYGGPYLELFARVRREGWESWGADLSGSGDGDMARRR